MLYIHGFFCFFFFFLNDTAPPDISPLPHHAALPIPGATRRCHQANSSPDLDEPSWRNAPSSASGSWRSHHGPVSTPSASSASRYAEIAASFGSRSEEHTSELQSQSNLVCRLLLEKKK